MFPEVKVQVLQIFLISLVNFDIYICTSNCFLLKHSVLECIFICMIILSRLLVLDLI